MTEEEARKFLGKDCTIEWKDPETGEEGGMGGLVAKVKDDWIMVDYGYGAYLPHVTSIEEVHFETVEVPDASLFQET